MIIGKKVSLRAVERADLPILKEWRNRTNYRQFFREYRELNYDMQEKWYNTKVINDNSTIMFSIINNDTNKIIGVCGLCYINWVNGTADLSLYIGWNNVYIDNNGYAKESCTLLFDYAFKELRLNKIWTEIYTIDEKKIDLYNQIGMKIDGTLRQNYFHNGEYFDSYIFSILKTEYLS